MMKTPINLRLPSLCVLVSLFGCAVPNAESVEVPATRRQTAPLSGPLSLLKQLPPWCKEAYGSQEVRLLEQIARELASYSLDEIHSALKVAERARVGEDPLTASSIYVLLRALFVLPDSESYKTVDRAISSSSKFLRPNCYRGDCDLYWLGWPLEWHAGRLVRVRPCEAIAGRGVLYDFVSEFEAMYRAYPRRSFPTE